MSYLPSIYETVGYFCSLAQGDKFRFLSIEIEKSGGQDRELRNITTEYY